MDKKKMTIVCETLRTRYGLPATRPATFPEAELAQFSREVGSAFSECSEVCGNTPSGLLESECIVCVARRLNISEDCVICLDEASLAPTTEQAALLDCMYEDRPDPTPYGSDTQTWKLAVFGATVGLAGLYMAVMVVTMWAVWRPRS